MDAPPCENENSLKELSEVGIESLAPRFLRLISWHERASPLRLCNGACDLDENMWNQVDMGDCLDEKHCATSPHSLKDAAADENTGPYFIPSILGITRKCTALGNA